MHYFKLIVSSIVDHQRRDSTEAKGDLYEYMLGKIATAGQNGHFHTPRRRSQLISVAWSLCQTA